MSIQQCADKYPFLYPISQGNSYRPPTKLRESNVFTGVCLFMGGACDISHDALALTV